MTLQQVILNSDIYRVCLSHAFVTDHEEIMGLLIGEIRDKTVIVHGVKVLIRSDKTPDRVEVSSDQLTNAMSYAEELSASLKLDLCVIGWYHSHPRITVHPSHVDLRTQRQYQYLDSLFVGIIFSVFNQSSVNNCSNVMVTCFQTNDALEEQSIPFEVQDVATSLHSLESLISIPNNLIGEETLAYTKAMRTCPSSVTAMHNKAVFDQAVVKVIEKITIPLMQQFEDEESSLKQILTELTKIHNDNCHRMEY